MFHYNNYELAIIISVPMITILLIWTLVIFHKNKKRWRAYDIAIVAILSESIIRNLSTITYIVLQRVDMSEMVSIDFCGAFIWIFNSAHTFQASCLTTLAIIGLFSIKLYRKQQSLRQYLTATHLIYHLFCLTTLCACVGVAAILAKQETILFTGFESNVRNCKFMPYQLDVKFNAFIIVLHIFLGAISFGAFVYICMIYWRLRKSGFDYLKKSTSDLSELSLSTVNPNEGNKNYFDTYTIQRNYGQYDSQAPLNEYNTMWKSDVSNVSTTVSSTNSRKPLNKVNAYEEHASTGLETIHPILVVCYVFYHLPVVIFCIFPNIIHPYSVASVALWLGLLQDVMIPVSLGILDTRFSDWVSRVYRCSGQKQVEGKLPHVGLDGKFRHFGSQPQSLEVHQMLPDRMAAARCYQNGEHKFPITNGSLYTSIEGRVPIIHNYRRHNNENRGGKLENNLVNLGVHSSNLKRQEFVANMPKTTTFQCTNCKKPHCGSNNDLNYNSASNFIRTAAYNLKPNTVVNNQILKPYLRHVSLSQDSLRQIPLGRRLNTSRELTSSALSLHLNSANKNQLRMSKSYDSLNYLHSDVTTLRQNNVDSEDEYFTDSVNVQNFDTMSTESSYSITTEANGDFEFYQNDQDSSQKLSRASSKSSSASALGVDFRIKRSNSKRSLENLQAYVNNESFNLQRSNSLISVEDKRRPLHMSAEMFNKTKEPHYLDLSRNKMDLNGQSRQFYAGSVPDLKKVFISEYI